jgi:hypothetical protein
MESTQPIDLSFDGIEAFLENGSLASWDGFIELLLNPSLVVEKILDVLPEPHHHFEQLLAVMFAVDALDFILNLTRAKSGGQNPILPQLWLVVCGLADFVAKFFDREPLTRTM